MIVHENFKSRTTGFCTVPSSQGKTERRSGCLFGRPLLSSVSSTSVHTEASLMWLSQHLAGFGTFFSLALHTMVPVAWRCDPGTSPHLFRNTYIPSSGFEIDPTDADYRSSETSCASCDNSVLASSIVCLRGRRVTVSVGLR